MTMTNGRPTRITEPQHAADFVAAKMIANGAIGNETVIVIALDIKKNVIAKRETFKGTQTSEQPASMFHPRSIFRFAIENNAHSIVVCHNHPSGDPQPSQADIDASKRLVKAGEIMGIAITDHIVIGEGAFDEGFVSMKADGLI